MAISRAVVASRVSVVALFAVLAAGCASVAVDSWPEGRARDSEDPFGRVYSALIEEGRVVKYAAEPLPANAVGAGPIAPKNIVDAVSPKPAERIHPLLKRWMEERPAAVESVIVRLRDDTDTRLPRFPEPALVEQRDSATNRAVRTQALNRADEIAKSRAARHRQFLEQFNRRLADAQVRIEPRRIELGESFWIIDAFAARMPVAAVPLLLQSDEVAYVEPEVSGEVPPGNNISDGRAVIVSDPYFNLGQTGGWIGLLDTGLRFSHTLFNGPSHIAFRFDCVNGGSNCTIGTSLNPNDDCWNHGTSTAAIITGNGNLGNASRGVTGITLDSFKVYPTSFNAGGGCNGGLNQTAVLRGFQEAILVSDRVIVAEMQGNGDQNSSISAAGDAAFDAGAVVIAANGNNGPAVGTVNTPANARRVIGVGNFDVQTLGQIASQSRGPTPDGRYKPDIQTPTNTVSASNASDTATQVFTGTSGATPYGAGAAALLRNWLRGTSFSIDPGQVYAQLILSGQQPFGFDNTSGAGKVRLPTDGWAWWGKVSINAGQTINIPIGISGASSNTFDGALWWPESSTHNDVDLYLVDPTGRVVATSFSGPSVFERARATGAVANGTWTLRIVAFHVTAPQTVYWAAHVRLR